MVSHIRFKQTRRVLEGDTPGLPNINPKRNIVVPDYPFQTTEVVPQIYSRIFTSPNPVVSLLNVSRLPARRGSSTNPVKQGLSYVDTLVRIQGNAVGVDLIGGKTEGTDRLSEKTKTENIVTLVCPTGDSVRVAGEMSHVGATARTAMAQEKDNGSS